VLLESVCPTSCREEVLKRFEHKKIDPNKGENMAREEEVEFLHVESESEDGIKQMIQDFNHQISLLIKSKIGQKKAKS